MLIMTNNILLIDDREDFASSLKDQFASKGWVLLHKKSLEGLKKTMPQLHRKLACVILDINCLHTDDQEIENPDFIGDAITYLDQNFPSFPRVILTGDDKEYNGYKRYNKSESVYLKTPNSIKELFNEIENLIKNSDVLRVKREYMQAFEVFENGILREEKEKELIELLLCIESPKTINLKDNIGKVRKFLEPIYKVINERSSAYLPDEVFTGDQVNLADAELYLTGRPITNRRYAKTYTPNGVLLPGHLCWMLPMLRMSTSTAGSHDYKEYVSENALKAVVFALLELLIWLNDFMKK